MNNYWRRPATTDSMPVWWETRVRSVLPYAIHGSHNKFRTPGSLSRSLVFLSNTLRIFITQPFLVQEYIAMVRFHRWLRVIKVSNLGHIVSTAWPFLLNAGSSLVLMPTHYCIPCIPFCMPSACPFRFWRLNNDISTFPKRYVSVRRTICGLFNR